eukprot:1416305-Rhodomonas_salina.1
MCGGAGGSQLLELHAPSSSADLPRTASAGGGGGGGGGRGGRGGRGGAASSGGGGGQGGKGEGEALKRGMGESGEAT